jgi:hypothetical protein
MFGRPTLQVEDLVAALDTSADKGKGGNVICDGFGRVREFSDPITSREHVEKNAFMALLTHEEMKDDKENILDATAYSVERQILLQGPSAQMCPTMALCVEDEKGAIMSAEDVLALGRKQFGSAGDGVLDLSMLMKENPKKNFTLKVRMRRECVNYTKR